MHVSSFFLLPLMRRDGDKFLRLKILSQLLDLVLVAVIYKWSLWERGDRGRGRERWQSRKKGDNKRPTDLNTLFFAETPDRKISRKISFPLFLLLCCLLHFLLFASCFSRTTYVRRYYHPSQMYSLLLFPLLPFFKGFNALFKSLRESESSLR